MNRKQTRSLIGPVVSWLALVGFFGLSGEWSGREWYTHPLFRGSEIIVFTAICVSIARRRLAENAA